MNCSTHPNAPHGFDRNGSHSQHRYVCECESWSPECTVAPEMLERALKFVMRSPWSEERAELANDLKKALMLVIQETIQSGSDYSLDERMDEALPSRMLRNAVRRSGQVMIDAKDQEIESLRRDLISCRGTVKTELNHYERLAMVHGKTVVAENYEREAQRLSELLDRIDALIDADKSKELTP